MIPNIHYPNDERYGDTERQTKCPHCGYVHKADISFYKECVNCRKSMRTLETNELSKDARAKMKGV